MNTIRYAASAGFDVGTRIAIDDATILSAIVDGLLDRYHPSISYEGDRNHGT